MIETLCTGRLGTELATSAWPDRPVLLLRPGDDAIDGGLEVAHRHRVVTFAHGVDGRLVGDVGEIRADEPRRTLRDYLEVDVVRECQFLGVQFEDRFAGVEVRLVDDDLPIEAPGAHERLVENLRPVGRGHHCDATGRVEAVHLGEQLIQGLLSLIVSAEAWTDAACAADRVEFVDEDYAGRLFARLFEQLADARGAYADEHLDELRAADV
jgi:hypothetical protein